MIRVSEPLLNGNEKKYLCEAIDAGEVSSSGRFVKRFEESFAHWSGNKYAIAVSSGMSALETAIWSVGIKELSIPSGTIISCYTAAIRAGAKVFLRDNFSLDGHDFMRCHLFGMFEHTKKQGIIDDLSQYWKPYKVPVIGCYSLYANKLITSGEGGVIVTNNDYLYKKAKSYRDLCHSKERFIHTDLGYNFRMSNIQAAVALAQLEQIDKFTKIKQRNRDLYLKYLPDEVKPMFAVEVPWMYLIKTKHSAKRLVKALADRSIESRRFFYPLHRQPCIKNKLPLMAMRKEFPVAENLWRHAFYIPSGLTLTEKEISHVSDELRTILRSV